MSLLHLVSRPERLAACLARAGAGDSVLLVAEAALAIVEPPPAGVELLRLDPPPERAAADPARAIDYPAFVALTERHPTILSW